MAEVAGTLLSVLAGRVRDPQFSSTPKDDARLLLGECQRAWNTHTGDAVVELTLTIEPHRLVYPIEPLLPTAARITAIRDASGRTIDRVPFGEIAHTSHKWFRQTGPRIEQWATIGRDLLVLHPALTAASTCTVVASALTASLTTDATATEVTDDELPSVLDLTEALLHLRMRQFDVLSAPLKRLAQRTEVS